MRKLGVCVLKNGQLMRKSRKIRKVGCVDPVLPPTHLLVKRETLAKWGGGGRRQLDVVAGALHSPLCALVHVDVGARTDLRPVALGTGWGAPNASVRSPSTSVREPVPSVVCCFD